MLRENAQAEEPRGRNTDALIRGGRLRSSVEAIVMIVERRGAGDRRLVRVNWRQEEPSC